MSCVMLFGIGDLGGWVLEFLARSEGVGTIITCDVREDWGAMKTECAAIGAGQQGYNKRIKFEKCDVNDIDETAELLKKYNPDVIYSALTLLGWLEMRVIPQAIGPKYHKASEGESWYHRPSGEQFFPRRCKSGVMEKWPGASRWRGQH